MRYLQKLLSREFYRSIIFWLLLLLMSYTLAGFLLVPHLVHKTLVQQVEQQLGWQAQIEQVKFNPYTFTLAINNLTITDQQAHQQLSLQRFYVNFELRSMIEGAFTFADIELLKPYINVELDKNGLSNFQLAMQQQLEKNPPLAETQPKETETETESSIPKLLFDNISVIDGNINFTDHTLGATVNHTFDPISFNLKDLFTYGENEGNYHLNIALGKNQTITWNGTLGITPLRSSGSLNINGFRVHDFWGYLAEQVPYTLKNALVNINGKYEFTMANEPMQLNIHQATIQIDKIKLANKQQEQNFAQIEEINIGPLDFNLADKKLQINTVKIDSVNLQIERSKQGLINLLMPFEDDNANTSAENTDGVANVNNAADNNETTVADTPFKWSVDNIVLNNSQIDFIDHQPTSGAEISVNKINFNLQGLSQDLSKNLPFNLSYYVDQAGETEINGQVTAAPLELQAHLSLKALALPMLQPYIADLAKVNLEQGKLSINGDINFSNDPAGQVQGNFQGAFNIDQFNTKDSELNQRLVGWQNLAIDPIKVNFNPLGVAIDKIAINKPYARLVITEDRSINLAKLAINNAPQNSAERPVDNAAKSTEKSTADKTDEQPVNIKIDNFTITDGGAYFADLSLHPQFATGIQKINGEINGLSSDNLERADVNISGSIEQYGKMLVKGKINPLSGDLYTDINADFKQIELAPLTPYSGRHVGYAIDKGKLSLNLNYKIANNTLDAENHLILDQFELGQTVASEEAVDVPLKLALALFKDSDGVIDLNVPISGDMNSPDFAIGPLVMKALMNLITKAVTSPFSMIANIVGGDADKLNSLAFNAGSAALSEDNIKQLNTLAKVLKSRPNLTLEIRAIVAEQQDSIALKAQKMQELLSKASINSNVDQEKRIAVIEQLLVQYNGKNEVSLLKNEMLNALTVAADDENQQQLIKDQYEQSLKTTLQDKQPLTNLELTELAQQRLAVIKAHLFEQGEIENKQVFALQPSLQGEAQRNQVATIFTLTSN